MTTPSPDVEIPPPETTTSETPSTFPDGSRCQHRYKNGKRCRLLGSEPQLGLCPRHFRQRVAQGLPPTDDPSDLSPELLRGLSKFSSAEDLREFLACLLVVMTKGRLSPRRAAVLAYVTNQLLHSHVVAEKESAGEEPQIIFDLPRPKRDDVISPERAYVNRMAELHARVTANPPEPDGYDGYTSDLDKSK